MQPGLTILALGFAALSGLGCRGAEGSKAQAASVPSRSGDVWELDAPENRATAPAAMLAFVNGVHVVVVDGDDVYAGTEKLDAKTAGFVADGDHMSVRLASGDTVRLRRQAPRAEAKR